MEKISLLIKPVSSRCNINCKYCFYKDEDQLRKYQHILDMDLNTLELIIKKSIEYVEKELDLVFQGGEPTLKGPSFYKKAVELVNKYNYKKIKVTYNLQTNGILINEEWCKFLKENNFLVGLSIDGPKYINDINRVDYENNSTFDYVLNTIKLFKKYSIDFNVLLVVTNANTLKAKECYNYLKSIGVEYFQISPAINPICTKYSDNDYFLDKGNLFIFLKDLFDAWIIDFIDGNEMRVTYFENIIMKMLKKPVGLCSMNGLCSIENVIEADGEVYPCDFYCDDNYSLGNIKDKSFKEIIFSSRAEKFINESYKINSDCRMCPYFGLCLGACKRYKLQDKNNYQNYYCEDYKKFFNYSYKNFVYLASLYKNII